MAKSVHKNMYGSTENYLNSAKLMKPGLTRPYIHQFSGTATATSTTTCTMSQGSDFRGFSNYRFYVRELRGFVAPRASAAAFNFCIPAAFSFNIKTAGTTSDWFNDPVRFNVFQAFERRCPPLVFRGGYLIDKATDVSCDFAYDSDHVVVSGVVYQLVVFMIGDMIHESV